MVGVFVLGSSIVFWGLGCFVDRVWGLGSLVRGLLGFFGVGALHRALPINIEEQTWE